MKTNENQKRLKKEFRQELCYLEKKYLRKNLPSSSKE
jgi:hypothetical protein